MDPTHPLTPILGRYRRRKRTGGFYHLASTAAFPGRLNLERGLSLRAANASETEVLRQLFEYYRELPARNPWETRCVVKPALKGKGTRTTVVELPRDGWRYHVVTFSGPGNRVYDLAEASVMSTGPVLDPGVHVRWGHMLGCGAGRGLRRVHKAAQFDDSALHSWTREQGADLRATYRLLRANFPRTETEGQPLNLRRALRSYVDLQELTMNREVRFLALFALLEGLLVHKPVPTDPYSSITRQVCKKMALLAPRFVRPLDYAPWVGNASAETVWKAMYGVRSEIAHGEAPNFSKKAAVLKDLTTAESLLQESVRSTLRQALEEPVLLANLREC